MGIELATGIYGGSLGPIALIFVFSIFFSSRIVVETSDISPMLITLFINFVDWVS
jgi:hypothetical protein